MHNQAFVGMHAKAMGSGGSSQLKTRERGIKEGSVLEEPNRLFDCGQSPGYSGSGVVRTSVTPLGVSSMCSARAASKSFKPVSASLRSWYCTSTCIVETDTHTQQHLRSQRTKSSNYDPGTPRCVRVYTVVRRGEYQNHD